jgi:hypothetical protein
MNKVLTKSHYDLKLLDNVILLEDVSGYDLKKGAIGTIVEMLGEDVYEVEFIDNQGQTYAMGSLYAHQLAFIPDNISEFLETEQYSYKIPTPENVPPLQEHKLDSKELLSAGVYQFLGKFVGHIYDKAMGTGEYNPTKILHSLQFNWLLEQIPTIQGKLDILLKSLPSDKQPISADISALFESATRVSRKTADAQKRNLLKLAIVNAFDINLYSEGITLRLMEILENLFYGDIVLLKRIKSESNSHHGYFQEELNDQELHYLEMLEKQSLVVVERSATPYQIRIRSLALKLLQLVAED